MSQITHRPCQSETRAPQPQLSSSVVESFLPVALLVLVACVCSGARVGPRGLDTFIAQPFLRDEVEIDAFAAGLLLDPAVSSLVVPRTRRAAAPIDDERDADGRPQRAGRRRGSAR